MRISVSFSLNCWRRKGEIILENSDDVLWQTSKFASPHQEKLQNMLLLSGGERCLTAIALLFLFLKLRPSPFV